jgi:hypothetical protein
MRLSCDGDSKLTSCNEEHLKKQDRRREVTVAGIVMEVNPDDEKTNSSIIVMVDPCDHCTLISEVHEQNDKIPRKVRDEGNVTDFNPDSRNAYCSIRCK